MFKLICVSVLIAVVIAAPQSGNVPKTGNIQKTSEYHLTAESTTPVPKGKVGLTRPAPINPDVHGDPKPKDSGKVETHQIHKRDTTTNNQNKDRINNGPVPATSIHDNEHKNPNNQPTTQVKPTVPAHTPVGTNQQGTPIKSQIPAHTPIATNQPSTGVHNNRRTNTPTVKPTSGANTPTPAIHSHYKRDTHVTDDKKPTSTTEQSTNNKNHNNNNNNNNRHSDETPTNYDNNKTPTFIHPVPVTQILGDNKPITRPVRADVADPNAQKTPTTYGNLSKPKATDAPTSTVKPVTNKPTPSSVH